MVRSSGAVILHILTPVCQKSLRRNQKNSRNRRPACSDAPTTEWRSSVIPRDKLLLQSAMLKYVNN